MYEEYDFDGVDMDCGTYWKGIQDRPTYKVVLGIPFYAQPGWTDYGAILAAAPEASDGDRVFIMVSSLNKSIQKHNNLMGCQSYAKHRFR
jgi:hypothetical protein